MILRPTDDGGGIAITQPAHAWVSAQFARAWGGAVAGVERLDETLILAVEQHDIGWHALERAPVRDPATGRPHDFLTLPRPLHTALWSDGVATAEACYGAEVALLISRHGRAVYALTPDEARSAEDRAAIARFRAEQDALEARLRPRIAHDDATLRERARLLFLFDLLALVACGAFGEGEKRAPPARLAAADARLDLRFQTAPNRLEIDPWPFRERCFEVACRARRLAAITFADEAAMRATLREAEEFDHRVLVTPR
ncbi:DUF3891 family protein [Elioraea thermophila]|uniref:DUF3891 family protein n=1 Tax=Elioraea thermophila TaxID=2185104 RepID=UPI000DF1C039|nr:DUF3891 family protein [Elioraea thermophila]